MSDLRFFNLSIPAPKRLAMMRAAFERHPIQYPHCPEHAKPADWRAVRHWGLHSYAGAFGLASIGANTLYSFDRTSLPVRDIRYSDEVYSRIQHKGWYADDDGSQGVIRGIVASLPHGRYLSGYHWSDNDEYVIFIGRSFDDENEAARDADREAERYAETCRDSNERFHAMQDAEGHAEAVADDVRHAFEARNVNAWHREYCRDRIGELRAARADLKSATEAYERG